MPPAFYYGAQQRVGAGSRLRPEPVCAIFDDMRRKFDNSTANPEWLRRPKPQPPLLRERSHWAMRLGWMVAQGGAVAGGMYFCFWSGHAPKEPAAPQAYWIVFLGLVVMTAFLTGLITALWNLAARASRRVAGRCAAAPPGEQAGQQELSARSPIAGTEHRHKVGGRH